MCTVFVSWQVHPVYDLIVCGNRDEFKSRPSKAAHQWEDNPSVFAGRDLKEGGTWMGVAAGGRFTVVTNYRDFSRHKAAAASRGQLTADYLTGSDAVESYLLDLSQRGEAYNPFNLLVADDRHLGYYSNVSGNFSLLQPGLYGLSNALLNTPWPKVSFGMEALSSVVKAGSLEAIVTECFKVLDSKAVYADDRLPSTGIALETERLLSSVFIDTQDYGTQYQTIILREKKGKIHFIENGWSPERGWQRQDHCLDSF